MSGMDAELFDQFIDQLDRYVRERLIPAEREVDRGRRRFPTAIVQEMRDMGLFGLTMPEEYGGAGMNISQYARVVDTMAYAVPAFRSIISINVGMVNSAIKNGGTEAQKAEWLPRLAAGEIACFGLTEPGSGSDSAAMQTTARPDPSGNGWVLNGTKRYITNAPDAKVALIMARTRRRRCPRTRTSRRLPRADGHARRHAWARPTRRWAKPAAISPTSSWRTSTCPARRCSAGRPARASCPR